VIVQKDSESKREDDGNESRRTPDAIQQRGMPSGNEGSDMGLSKAENLCEILAQFWVKRARRRERRQRVRHKTHKYRVDDQHKHAQQ